MTTRTITRCPDPPRPYQEPSGFRYCHSPVAHDGDTTNCLVMEGPHSSDEWALRSARLNAPDPDRDGQAASQAATAFWTRLLEQHGRLEHGTRVLVVEILGDDKYGGRLVAEFWGWDQHGQPVNLNNLMLASGHAKPWDGRGPKP